MSRHQTYASNTEDWLLGFLASEELTDAHGEFAADGQPLDGDPPVPAGALPLLNQQGVNRLRRCEDRITRTIRATDAQPGGRPFNPGNRG
jgi:hypothetical protein